MIVPALYKIQRAERRNLTLDEMDKISLNKKNKIQRLNKRKKIQYFKITIVQTNILRRYINLSTVIFKFVR